MLTSPYTKTSINVDNCLEHVHGLCFKSAYCSQARASWTFYHSQQAVDILLQHFIHISHCKRLESRSRNIAQSSTTHIPRVLIRSAWFHRAQHSWIRAFHASLKQMPVADIPHAQQSRRVLRSIRCADFREAGTQEPNSQFLRTRKHALNSHKEWFLRTKK